MTESHPEGDFQPYPKMRRIKSADMTITEKIDGRNGQILIADGTVQLVGSRKREIFPNGTVEVGCTFEPGRTVFKEATDNLGFAQWVRENEAGLVEFLGDGRHYGEWAGPGIQKNPLGLPERRFFLFNTQRHPPEKFESSGHLVPSLRSVPILYCGPFNMNMISVTHKSLVGYHGSQVTDAEKPQNAEGIVISCFGQKLKLTADDRPKGLRE